MNDLYRYLQVDRSSSVPLYQQLVSGLIRYCRVSSPGTMLPPERVLSQRLGVSRWTLRLALKTASAEGYLVSHWAKGIVVSERPSSSRILVIVSGNNELAVPWNYTLPGIQQRADELGLCVREISSDFLRVQTPDDIGKMLRREAFRGVLHLDYMAWPEAPDIVALAQCDLPVLFPHACLEWFEETHFPMTIVDEQTAFAEALRALVELGHRNIVTLAADNGGQALRGFTPESYGALLRSLGANPDRGLCRFLPYDEGVVDGEIQGLLESGCEFSAVLCFSDFYAMLVMKSFRKRGIRVPEEVSVMGYCGYPGGELLEPGLSTVDFQYFQIGRSAVDRLLTIPSDWRGLAASQRLSYSPTCLRLRASVGAWHPVAGCPGSIVHSSVVCS